MQAIEWGGIALEVRFECLQWQQVEKSNEMPKKDEHLCESVIEPKIM